MRKKSVNNWNQSSDKQKYWYWIYIHFLSNFLALLSVLFSKKRRPSAKIYLTYSRETNINRKSVIKLCERGREKVENKPYRFSLRVSHYLQYFFFFLEWWSWYFFFTFEERIIQSVLQSRKVNIRNRKKERKIKYWIENWMWWIVDLYYLFPNKYSDIKNVLFQFIVFK